MSNTKKNKKQYSKQTKKAKQISKNQSLKLKITKELLEDKDKYIKYLNGTIEFKNTIDKQPIKKNTEFLIGSVTKIFTALIIFLLHQQNKLNIYDNINKYIKLPNDNNNYKIIDILNHCAGLKTMSDKYDNSTEEFSINNKNLLSKEYKSSTEVFNTFKNEYLLDKTIKLNKYPEEQFFKKKIKGFSYSNIGYQLLSYLIEVITKQNYKLIVKKYILEPYNMSNTGFTLPKTILYTKLQQKLNKYERIEPSYACGSGQLKSSVKDLEIFFNKLPTILDEQTFKLFLKNIYFVNTENIHNTKNKGYNFYHTGGIYGAKSMVNCLYDKNFNIKHLKIVLKTVKN